MIYIDATIIGEVISYLGDPWKNPSFIILKNVQFHCLFISFLHQNWIKHDDILT